MNGFDIALIAIVALSTLFAFARGIVRELIALASWVAALIAAFAYAGTVANWLSGIDMSAAGKHVRSCDADQTGLPHPRRSC